MKQRILFISGILILLSSIFLLLNQYTSFSRYDIIKSHFNNRNVIVDNKDTSNKISLNTASLKELDENLAGIGPAKANQIIEHRNKQPFSDTYELVTLKIISDNGYDKIKDKITI